MAPRRMPSGVGRLPATPTDKLGVPTEFRHYQPADLASLTQMYTDFMPKRAAQGLPPADELRLRSWLSSILPRGIHIIAEQNSHIVGHAMLVPWDPDNGRGSEFANFVHQSVRNRGIGTMLGRAALEASREVGCKSIWLSVEPSNRAAVRSYMRLGFNAIPGALAPSEMEMQLQL